MISFLDPAAPAEPTGVLLLSSCDDCGAAAAVIDWYAGPVRCAGCWSAVCGTDPMRPIVPTSPLAERRFAGGERPSGYERLKSAHSCRLCGRWLEGEWSSANAVQRARLQIMMSLGRCDRHATTEPGENGLGRRVGTSSRESSPYRVLIAARDATSSQIPSGAAALCAAARDAGRTVRVTYALAEERATGRMVHTCAVRIAGLGYAVWVDGQYSSARPNVNRGHMLALAAGAEYVPPEPRPAPPVGPCPRQCGKIVRWRIVDGVPTTYKHQRDAGAEGGRGQRVVCE
jgi:hypothetical protein